MKTFSNTLIDRIRQVKRSSIFIDANCRHSIVKNLLFLHDAVLSSEQLLIESASCIESLPDNEFHQSLRRYYLSHLEEERDELRWLRDDLKSANIVPGLPDSLAMAMVGTQYYMLKHVHPAALLGYMAVVEGDPTPLEDVSLMEGKHGEQLLRFVRYHAVEDMEHSKELLRMVDSAPPSICDVITFSAENVLGYLKKASELWRHDR